MPQISKQCRQQLNWEYSSSVSCTNIHTKISIIHTYKYMYNYLFAPDENFGSICLTFQKVIQNLRTVITGSGIFLQLQRSFKLFCVLVNFQQVIIIKVLSNMSWKNAFAINFYRVVEKVFFCCYFLSIFIVKT